MKPSRGSFTRRSSISATIFAIRSASLFARSASMTLHSSSVTRRNRADSSSMSGRAATRRSQASSTSVTCAAVEATAATPISARRWRSRLPVSATATPGCRLRTSAMIDRTTERFCLSDRMSPSSTSSVRAPTYTPASYVVSVPRLLPHLVGLDHVAEVDVVVADADTAFVALADLGHVVLEPAQRLDREALRDHDTVADQAGSAAAVDGVRPDDALGDVADSRHAEDLFDLRRAELR